MPRKDLSAADFNAQLAANSFAEIRRGQFVDLRDPRKPRQLTDAVTRGYRMSRKDTLAALLKARAERLATAAAAAAAQLERERVAAAIAPVALPPARAELAEEAAIATMADDFVVLASRNEGVTLPDLLRLGWRKDQIFELVDTARNVAYARQGGNAA